MRLQEAVEILYHYIVEGYSMERTGNVTGYTTAEVSELVRGYGFNEDAHQRTGWQSGKDRGRYGRGKPAAHGVTVTRNHIADWIQNWNCTFEEYLLEISADDRRRQQQIIPVLLHFPAPLPSCGFRVY